MSPSGKCCMESDCQEQGKKTISLVWWGEEGPVNEVYVEELMFSSRD